MASVRRQRLSRIADMWDEDLRTCAGALAQARARADEARRALEELKARTAGARDLRMALMGGASADEWRAREAWIATCAAREERGASILLGAEQAVLEASRAVTTAQQKVERMKLVLARLAAQEALIERRSEQRSQDEIAARISQSHTSRNPAADASGGGERR
jgi:flagellar biosynthesis chaperone FliJ